MQWDYYLNVYSLPFSAHQVPSSVESDGLTQVSSAPSGPRLSAGRPWMPQQLKVHMGSGVAPGRAYCSVPVCRPEARGAAGRHTSEGSGRRCARIRGQKVFLASRMMCTSRTSWGPRAIPNCKCQCPGSLWRESRELALCCSQPCYVRCRTLNWGSGREREAGVRKISEIFSTLVFSSNRTFLI